MPNRPRISAGALPWLGQEPIFPPLDAALQDPNGLLAAGGSLSLPWLLAAYSKGIFPWYSEGEPILWWSPSPRMVLFTDELYISRSMSKVLRNTPYEIRVDTAFEEVIQACSEPRPGQTGTWITPDMVIAYTALYQQGYAHSFETWIDGTLAGGLYGVAIGRMFYGESMFTRRNNASKLALIHMVQHLRCHGVSMIDCQSYTPHLHRLGARFIARGEFVAALRQAIQLEQHHAMWVYQGGGR